MPLAQKSPLRPFVSPEPVDFTIDEMTVLLGKPFSHKEQDAFEAEHQKILRFTYRKNFPPLSGYTSDRHWGCAIRCSQSLLAQFLHKCFQTVEKMPLVPEYETLFFDLPECAFGIHAFCREIEALGGKAGEWCQVSTLAQAIKTLLKRVGLNALVAQDGMISRGELRQLLAPGMPVLVLVPVMLGTSGIDKSYANFVRLALGLDPQAVGIVGGQQGKAFYVVGYQGDNMLYFDPHITVEAVLDSSGLDSLRMATLKTIAISELNSSMMAGFFVRSQQDVEVIPIVSESLGSCPIAVVDELPHADQVVEEGDWLVVE